MGVYVCAYVCLYIVCACTGMCGMQLKSHIYIYICICINELTNAATDE